MDTKYQHRHKTTAKHDVVLVAAKQAEQARDLELQRQNALAVADVRFIPQAVARRAKLLSFK